MVLGDQLEQQVCIIKTALGTPSLNSDLASPSMTKSGNQAGAAYLKLTQQIQDSLSSLSDKFPDYTDAAGYEIAGVVLNVGEQDSDPLLYGVHLKTLIADLRSELKIENLPVIIVGTGRGGYDETEFSEIIQIQQSIAASPQYQGTVAYVETRDFWPEKDARDAFRYPSHERWFDNAESFYLMGNAIGKQMLKLLQ